MLYTFYEMGHALLGPSRLTAKAMRQAYRSPLNPMSQTLPGRTIAAAADVFESVTRRYGKPSWDIASTNVNGSDVPVAIRSAWRTAWCDLLRFDREPTLLRAARGERVEDPKVLIVAPMSGHYATLLKGTVEAFLPEHEVYITDWADARNVPIWRGRFGFDDYVAHVREALTVIGPQTHVLAVCQPGPAVLAAIALMSEDEDPNTPASLTVMGSPIDARLSPTEPNRLAEENPLSWFRDNLISTVPWPNPGALRRVYPGFVQLAGFMDMNWDRHVNAHWSFFQHLVQGDGDHEEKHRTFYDEYLAVMDLTEEFYLETVDRVFQQHLLARGKMVVSGRKVRPENITSTALFTVEGENDDISGIGQTQAAHTLCAGLPDKMKLDYIQPDVGHYGVFNGRRFREEIQPRVAKFMREHWNRKLDFAARERPHLRLVSGE